MGQQQRTEQQLGGIHHITAVAADPQRNVDFYVGVLGLRLVKRSVNQDDPQTYHFFYADAEGHPGTDLTFFSRPEFVPGRRGTSQAIAVGLAIPMGAASYWTRRLRDHDVSTDGPIERLDETVVSCFDPDGLAIELVAGPGTDRRELWTPWEAGPVPVDYAIRGLHGATLHEAALDPTATFLLETLGFRVTAQSGNRTRFGVGRGGSGAMIDVLVEPGPRGRVAAGTVHHVAWRTPDEAQQTQWREAIDDTGVSVTPIIDRFWFRSIYFHEPGGVLFEIATDGPGFAIDETHEELGQRLILPPWLESARPQIEAALPPVHLPETGPAAWVPGREPAV